MLASEVFFPFELFLYAYLYHLKKSQKIGNIEMIISWIQQWLIFHAENELLLLLFILFSVFIYSRIFSRKLGGQVVLKNTSVMADYKLPSDGRTRRCDF